MNTLRGLGAVAVLAGIAYAVTRATTVDALILVVTVGTVAVSVFTYLASARRRRMGPPQRQRTDQVPPGHLSTGGPGPGARAGPALPSALIHRRSDRVRRRSDRVRRRRFRGSGDRLAVRERDRGEQARWKGEGVGQCRQVGGRLRRRRIDGVRQGPYLVGGEQALRQQVAGVRAEAAQEEEPATARAERTGPPGPRRGRPPRGTRRRPSGRRAPRPSPGPGTTWRSSGPSGRPTGPRAGRCGRGSARSTRRGAAGRAGRPGRRGHRGCRDRRRRSCGWAGAGPGGRRPSPTPPSPRSPGCRPRP